MIKGSLFAYCNNNPIGFIDNNGRYPTPSPTVPERDKYINRSIVDKISFDTANERYKLLYPNYELANYSVLTNKDPSESFSVVERTYNWEKRAAYDVAFTLVETSGEIGSMVSRILEGYGMPIPFIEEIVDNTLKAAGQWILPAHAPETHQYSTYCYKKEYYNSVDGYRYVSLVQEFYSCELASCELHNTGSVRLQITLSNDIVPFYVGTTQTYNFIYNVP